MTVSGQAPVTYIYDAASRLRTITQAPLNPVNIDYDPLGRRTLLALPNGVSTEYQYDAASRLTALLYRSAAGLLGDLQYTYDATGSTIAVGGSFARTLLPDPVSMATYDAANRQIAFGSKTMTFDANGNLLSQTDATGMTAYSWDARNRLIAVSGPSITANFTYDVSGRRVTKTINGGTTMFHYDGPEILKEAGPIGEAFYLRTLAIDEVLTRTDATGVAGYLTDTLGSTVALATNDGTVATEYTYEPFGLTQATGPPSPNPLQFTGREDDGTGLYYFRARYYTPRMGRFLQEDPLGLPGAANLYWYVGDNPIASVDPFGLQAEPPRFGAPPVTGLPPGLPGSPVRPAVPNLSGLLNTLHQQLGIRLAGLITQEIAQKFRAFEKRYECGKEVPAAICFTKYHPLGTVTISETPVMINTVKTTCIYTTAIGSKNCCPEKLLPPLR